MPRTNHGPETTNSDVHDEARDEPYEDWTVAELRERAAELGVEGRSYMKKARLVRALRNR